LSESLRLEATRVSELHLEPSYIVSKAQKIPLAIELMRRYNVDRVVVVSDSKVVGVVTLKDIFSKLSSKRMSGVSPTSLSVAAFASPNIITAHPEESAREAAGKMLKHNVSALPVVGDDGVVRGLVTKLLLIPLMSKSNLCCKEFATPSYLTISPRSKLSSALERLSKTPVRELVVVEADRPLGVIGEREAAFTLFNLLRIDQIRHFDTFIKRLLVVDAMRRLNVALSGEESLKEAARLMRSSGANTLPLVKEGKVFGVLNRDNIFERLMQLEGEGRR
jgi:CBS domain-containing protein